jgi:hypothetical protein
MSSCNARPVKFTVTKLTIPEKLAAFLSTFLTNMQILRYGRDFDNK